MVTKLIVLFLGVVGLCLIGGVLGYKQPYQDKDSQNSLQLAFVIFNHGETIHDAAYAKDPYANLTYYPLGYGQLTKPGIRRAYKLGRTLRKSYRSFLGELYYAGIVFPRSLMVDRAKTTLLAALAGLFPPHPINQWDDEELALLWYPIPFLDVPPQNDTTLNGDTCPNFLAIYRKFEGTNEFKKIFDKYQDIYEIIEENSGINMTDRQRFKFIYYPLKFQKDYGLKLPAWVKRVTMKRLAEGVVDTYYAYSYTQALKKYASGFLFKDIIEQMRAKIDDKLTTRRKMYLYSGQQKNIAFTLITLGAQFNQVPNYCENIRIELHKSNNEYFVRVYHQRDLDQEPKPITISGCSFDCPFESFVGRLADTLPGPGDTCWPQSC